MKIFTEASHFWVEKFRAWVGLKGIGFSPIRDGKNRVGSGGPNAHPCPEQPIPGVFPKRRIETMQNFNTMGSYGLIFVHF